jgi:hypothetical protein
MSTARPAVVGEPAAGLSLRSGAACRGWISIIQALEAFRGTIVSAAGGSSVRPDTHLTYMINIALTTGCAAAARGSGGPCSTRSASGGCSTPGAGRCQGLTTLIFLGSDAEIDIAGEAAAVRRFRELIGTMAGVVEPA